jgi:putative ABC transport system substrate-binding protein
MNFDWLQRREFIALLGGAATWPLPARTQQRTVPVIGVLSILSADDSHALMAAFRQGLRESGYIEGQNVAIEYRWAEGRPERLPALAADLVNRPVDAILTSGGTVAATVAKSATRTIPIVFNIGADPVKAGLVASLNRPGGNVTGVSWLSITLTGKRFELLHEILPRSVNIAFLDNSVNPNIDSNAEEAETAARSLGLSLNEGAKPADLPVQQSSKFEFVINLKTAKALGLDVPPSLLVRADEVIE